MVMISYDSQANCHLEDLKNCSFNFRLTFFSKIIPRVEILFGQLQITHIDPSSANKAVSSLEKNIMKIREEVNAAADEHVINDPIVGLSKKRKTDTSAWKREAKEVCDVIISKVKERFSFTGNLVAWFI